MRITLASLLIVLFGCDVTEPLPVEFTTSSRVNCTFTRYDNTDAPGACLSITNSAIKDAVEAAIAATQAGTATPSQTALLANKTRCAVNAMGEDEYCVACTYKDGTRTGACKNGDTND